MLKYTTYAQQRAKEKNGEDKTDDSVLLVYAVYHFLFIFLCFSFRPLFLINPLDSPTFLTLYSLNPCLVF